MRDVIVVVAVAGLDWIGVEERLESIWPGCAMYAVLCCAVLCYAVLWQVCLESMIEYEELGRRRMSDRIRLSNTDECAER